MQRKLGRPLRARGNAGARRQIGWLPRHLIVGKVNKREGWQCRAGFAGWARSTFLVRAPVGQGTTQTTLVGPTNLSPANPGFWKLQGSGKLPAGCAVRHGPGFQPSECAAAAAENGQFKNQL